MTQTFEISLEEKEHFVQHGYIIRRAFVPPGLTQSARRIVEEWYKTSLDVTAIERYTQKTFAPDLGNHPDLLDVYYGSGLEALSTSLVYPDAIQPVTTVQIQIRIPDKILPTAQPE